MLQKYFFLTLLCFVSFFLVGCGDDNSAASSQVIDDEPDDDVVEDSTPARAVLSSVTVDGGLLQQAFSNDESAENTYIIDVARYNTTDTLTIDVMPETGATVAATLSTDPDDSASDTTLTGDSFTINIADITVTSVLTVVITKANQTTTTYTFTVDASSRSSLPEEIQDIILLAGVSLHEDDLLGTDMDFDGDRIVIGLPGYDGSVDSSTVSDSGAALILARSEATWKATFLQPPALSASDAFGSTVAIQEGMVIVGAPGEDGDASSTLAEANDNLMNSGAVHVYEYDAMSMSWNASHYIKSSIPVAEGAFGALIDVWFATNSPSTAQIAVGSSGADTVEVFVRTVESATDNTPASDDFQILGSVASIDFDPLLLGQNPIELNHRFLLVGQPSYDDNLLNRVNQGLINLYYRPGGATTAFSSSADHATGIGGLRTGSQYGYAVAIYDNYIVAGEPGSSNGGRVHIDEFTEETFVDDDYVETSTYLETEYTVEAPNTNSGDRFGSSVDLLGNVLLVGAPGNDGNAETTLDTIIDPDADDYVDNSGAIYTFLGEDDPDDAADAFWEVDAFLKPTDVQAEDAFGSVTRIAEDGTVVGISRRGAYVFQ